MPLPIYTAVGPSTGKYEGSVPLVSYMHSGKMHLLLQRGQEHSDAWTWTPGRRLLLAFPLSYLAWNFSLSKLAWGGQPPRATSCPQQKGTDDGILLLQGRNELPTKNLLCMFPYLS